MAVILEQEGGLSRIRLKDAIDIGCAQELKDLLEQGLKTSREVRVSVTEATRLDVAALQLLWAARREAKTSSVGFVFEGQTPEALSTELAEAGLESFAASGELS